MLCCCVLTAFLCAARPTERRWKGSRYARPGAPQRRRLGLPGRCDRRSQAACALRYNTSDEEEDDPWDDYGSADENLSDDEGGHHNPGSSMRPVVVGTGAEASVPTVYKTGEGACTIETSLDGLNSVRDLVMRVVETGRAQVDADITASAIRLHYMMTPSSKPCKVTRETKWSELQRVTALIVTPATHQG